MSTSSIVGTVVPTGAYVAVIDASLNAYKPCLDYELVTTPGDKTKTGTLAAISGSREFVVPQTTLFDQTAIYTICYSVKDGTVLDTTWADSYIRFSISQVSHRLRR